MKKFIPILMLLAFIIACDANSMAETFTVKFDSDGGTEIRDQIIKKGNMATEPSDPIKAGTAGFKAWTLDGAVYDFSTPVTKDITLVATYTEIYSVSFDTGKGSSIPMQNVTEGEKAIEPKDPTLAGYTFDAWNTVDGKKFDFNTPITESIVLTAKYYKNGETFTVSFWSMGGGEFDNQTVVAGDCASFPGMPTNNTKWGFRAWAIRSGDDEPYSYEEFDFKTPITNNLVLHAWYWEKYTVSFNTDGGSSVKEQVVKEGTSAVEPSAPTKDNALFKEWQLDGAKYDFSTKVNSSITLKAVYDSVYTVKFDSDGGTSISDQRVKSGEYAVAPANPEKANTKGFKYWSYTSGDKTQIFDFSKPITSDITLKANYWPDYNNQTGETDKELEALKNEVGNLFKIIKDIKETSGLMSGKTAIGEAFTIDASKHSDTVLDLFARFGGNHKYIYDDKGKEYDIGDSKFYYEIEVDSSEIKTNKSTTKTISSSMNITEYDMAIDGLTLTLKVRMNTDPAYEATLKRTFDIAATLFDYGSGQIEVSAKCKMNGTEYPMLYGIYEKSVTHGSYSEPHFYFSYKGYTGQILPDNDF